MQASALVRRPAPIILIAALFILLVAGVTLIAPDEGYFGWDWYQFFRPSLQGMLNLQTPYNGWVFNPTWVLLAMLPLALLPVKVGAAILAVANLAAIGITARRLGAAPLTIVAILLTPPALMAVSAGGIDGLVLLGFILPPQAGLFFVLAKPQMGAGIALYWLYEAYQRGGLRECVRVFAPVTIALALSFLVYGLYPLQYRNAMSLIWNVTPWPYAIPLGVGLFAFAIRKGRPPMAGAAGLCFTPYLNYQSYVLSLFTLLPGQWGSLIICLANWVIFLVIVITRHAI